MANGNVDIMNAVMDTFFQKMSPLVFKLLSLKPNDISHFEDEFN